MEDARPGIADALPAGVVRLGGSDAGELLTVQRSAYAEQARLHQDPDLPPLTQTLDELRAELADGDVIALGMRDAGRLVAAVRLRLEPAARRATLGRLVVVPDRQGQGLGTRLLVAAESVVPSGITRIELFTGEHSAANLRLYDRHGYVETRRTTAQPRFAHPYALVHLAKSIRSG